MKDKFKLVLETNPEALRDDSVAALDGTGIVITPPIAEDFWFWRAAVSDKQAIVGFPKFTIYGIGFQVEDDNWNTNLPPDARDDREEGIREIHQHIRCNQGDDSIPEARILKAIGMVYDAIIAQRARDKAERAQPLDSFRR
jgi:hypothetical protein